MTKQDIAHDLNCLYHTYCVTYIYFPELFFYDQIPRLISFIYFRYIVVLVELNIVTLSNIVLFFDGWTTPWENEKFLLKSKIEKL